MKDIMKGKLGAPKIVDRSTFQTELDALRVLEKSHTREGDAIAAARRRLPMVEVDGATPLIGKRGAVTLLDAFEGRRMLIAYYFMWHTGRLAATAKRYASVPYHRPGGWIEADQPSHRPVVSPEGRTFGRPGNRQALSLSIHNSNTARFFWEKSSDLKAGFAG